jgi:hypothetical protein
MKLKAKSVTKIIISVSKAAWRRRRNIGVVIIESVSKWQAAWHQWQNGRNKACQRRKSRSWQPASAISKSKSQWLSVKRKKIYQ